MKLDKITMYLNQKFNLGSGDTTMASNTVKYDDFMNNFVDKIKQSSDEEAGDYIFDLIDKKEMESISGNFYKYKDFHILSLFEDDGKEYIKILKKLSDLNLGITQKYIESINTGNEVYIITQIPGTEKGELIPLSKVGIKSIPKENRIKAFHDLQKLTKAGLIDDSVADSNRKWFVTSDKEIVIPVFERLRTIKPTESRKDILDKYYQVLNKE